MKRFNVSSKPVSHVAFICFCEGMCPFNPNVFEDTLKNLCCFEMFKIMTLKVFHYSSKNSSYANLVVLVNLIVLVILQVIANIVTAHSYGIINKSFYLNMLYILYWTQLFYECKFPSC